MLASKTPRTLRWREGDDEDGMNNWAPRRLDAFVGRYFCKERERENQALLFRRGLPPGHAECGWSGERTQPVHEWEVAVERVLTPEGGFRLRPQTCGNPMGTEKPVFQPK